MENSSFETLPEDLQMELLSRLPLKSLMRCMCVSKKWASLIRGEQFRKVYLSRSMTRPRVMFMVERYTSQPPEPEVLWFHSVYQEERLKPGPPDTEVLFHSVYQEEKPLLSSGQQQLRIALDPSTSNISQPIRGLICLQLGTKVAICNPGTKKFQTLPEIQAHKNADITSFFGYDDVTNVFKVLCMTRLMSGKPLEGPEEYQVLTVGSGEEESSWRRITCKHDHSPVTEGLCKGGVLYYGARSNGDKSLVMSFNVRSEEFTAIEFPDRSVNSRWKFVIYNGRIALVDDSDFDIKVVNEPNGNKVFHIWVMDEIARNWRRNRIEIPRWEQDVGNIELFFKGTTGTGELVFAQYFDSYGRDLFVLYYDTVTKNLRIFNIRRVVGYYPIVRTFLDHVDSTWLM